jgi:hypothetical protein
MSSSTPPPLTGAPAPAGGRLAELAAGFPLSLRLTDAADAELREVDGAPGWPERVRAALIPGVRGVLLRDPVPADPATIHEVAAEAARRGVVVEIADRARVTAVADAVADQIGGEETPGMVDVLATLSRAERADLPRILGAAALLIARFAGEIATIEQSAITDGSTSFVATTARGWRAVGIVAISDGDPGLRAERIHASSRVVVDCGHPRSGRPGAVTVYVARDGFAPRQPWEDADRYAWRRLIRDVRAASPADDLEAYARAVAAIGPLRAATAG